MWADRISGQAFHAVKHQSKDHDFFFQVPAHAKQELSAEIMTSALACGIIRIYKCPGMSISKPLIECLYFAHKRSIELYSTGAWGKKCFSVKHQLNYLVLGRSRIIQNKYRLTVQMNSARISKNHLYQQNNVLNSTTQTVAVVTSQRLRPRSPPPLALPLSYRFHWKNQCFNPVFLVVSIGR